MLRRIGFTIAVLLELVAASAFCEEQSIYSARAIREFSQALTTGGLFGAPRYATASLPTCNSLNPGAITWDSTALTLKVCDGSSWTGVGGLASGTTAITGCQNRILYGNNSNVLECEAALAYTTSNDTLTLTGTLLANKAFHLGTDTGTSNSLRFLWATAMTPDVPVMYTSALGNSVHIAGITQDGADLNNGRAGTAAAGDPVLVIHSRNTSSTQYVQLSSQNATGAAELQTNLADVVVGGSKATITEGSAQVIISVGIPNSTNVYGMTVFYTVYDINGANYTARTGSVKVQGGNSAGTAVCTINTGQDQETEDGSQIATSNAGTLTYTWTNAVSTTNCNLSLNATSSEGVNTYAITWTATLTGNSSAITVTPQ